MKINSNDWQLYTNDINFVRDWVKINLKKYGLNFSNGHQALNVGLTNLIIELLDSSANIENALQGSLRFRIARKFQENNPHKYLYHSYWHKIINDEITNCLKTRRLQVALNGGLGDHLEAISLLSNFTKRKDILLEIDLSQKYLDILKDIILLKKNIKISSTKGINYSAFRYWLNDNEPNFNFDSWISLPRINRNLDSYLFCWKAAIGTDKFSCHVRSVAFQNVLEMYRWLSFKSNKKIIDISNWNDNESQSLTNIGIDLYRPDKGKLKDLIDLVKTSEVITIDTALAHLCASLGKKAFVLLPFSPDERWLELNKKDSCYHNNLITIQQEKYFSWIEPIKKVFDYLQ